MLHSDAERVERIAAQEQVIILHGDTSVVSADGGDLKPLLAGLTEGLTEDKDLDRPRDLGRGDSAGDHLSLHRSPVR